MKDFLKKIKLIDTLTVTVDDVTKSEFVSKFKPHVDEGDIGIFSGLFEVFSSSKNQYKGEVSYDGFKIRKRRKIFDTNRNFAIATATYRQSNDKLFIETEINGGGYYLLPLYLFLFIFYIAVVGIFISTESPEGGFPGFAIPFLVVHALLMFGVPYFFMRRSVKKMKHDLERELFFIIKKSM